MLFNERAMIFTFSGTQVRIAEIERLQSLFKTSMDDIDNYRNVNVYRDSQPYNGRKIVIMRIMLSLAAV